MAVFGLPQWALDLIDAENAKGPEAPPPLPPSGQPVPYVPIVLGVYDPDNVQARNSSFEDFLGFVGLALSTIGVGFFYSKVQSSGNESFPVQPAYFILNATDGAKSFSGAWTLYHYDMFQNKIENAIKFVLSRMKKNVPVV